MARFNLGSLFGDRDLENMLSRIDNLSHTLSLNKQPVSKYDDGTSEAFRTFIKTLEDDKESDSVSINQMLQSITVPAQRTNRYMIYDEMYSSVQLIKSILRVYVNNVLQRDVVTGKCIILNENSKQKTNSNQTEIYKKYCQEIIDYYNLEHQLNFVILPQLLKYGDHFIELIDLKEVVGNLPAPNKDFIKANGTTTMPLSDTKLITEELDFINRRLNQPSDEVTKEQTREKMYSNIVDMLVEIDTEPDLSLDMTNYFTDELITERENLLKTKSKKDKQKAQKIEGFESSVLNRFVLRYHDPKQMVILTTVHNNTILGYVEIRETRKVEITPGVGMQFASMIKQISAVSKDKTENHGIVSRKIVRKIIEKLVSKLDVQKINLPGKSKEEINRNYENQLYSKMGEELFYLVKKLYLESDPQRDQQITKINVRFIPVDRMIHLCYNPNEYSPYGTSIIDPLVYPGKLYLLTQLTNVVMKLSRASLIRKWTKSTVPSVRDYCRKSCELLEHLLIRKSAAIGLFI